MLSDSINEGNNGAIWFDFVIIMFPEIIKPVISSKVLKQLNKSKTHVVYRATTNIGKGHLACLLKFVGWSSL